MMTRRELQVAEEAARAGGAVAMRFFRKDPAVSTKETDGKVTAYNLVSEADVAAERAIVEVIRRAFPKHAVLGEELNGGDGTSEAVLTAGDLWVVDPIDGTNNYVHGVPHFGVSVAYYQGGEAVCGVMGNPPRDEWFLASRGEGATFAGERVRVNGNPRLEDALVAYGYYYDRGAMMEATLSAVRDLLLREIHGVRRMGAATLDLAYVALGHFGAYFEYELAPWDFAAGRLFVEEAGGRVTDGRGNPLPLARTSLVASNGLIHDAVLDIVAARHPATAPDA
ncbi:Inositol-1-monophosphatase [Aquisphaera giovannonii]|uniref:Inositol-1-monophosphatase n=1 Tax=Aquisphaera giovannonii TaxID=406548 RepID=A0A5B9W6F1_9BACT|nr:inositol monophosphatase family protein [Aquisphaera giovannonii]QEH35907.1 Inositol-1-monophosphatase [Aquisphaera giovannonii]